MKIVMKKIAVAMLLCTQLSISDATTIVFDKTKIVSGEIKKVDGWTKLVYEEPEDSNEYLLCYAGPGCNLLEHFFINEKAVKQSCDKNHKAFEEITLEILGKFDSDGEYVRTIVGIQALSGLNSKYLRLKLKCTLGIDNSPVIIEDFYRLCKNSTSLIGLDLECAVPGGIIKDAREMFDGCSNLNQNNIMWGEACRIPEGARRDNAFFGLQQEPDGFEIITKENAVVQDW